MKGLLIYLALGTIFGIVVENIWNEEEEGPLNMTYRVFALLLWPLIIVLAIIQSLGDDNNFIGPGGAS